ncbi:hypothetical protein [Gemmata sp.]|uniref:hypothetical protein n=1 Tax=Gemmata sp. TaxID=1914242 RepID=UPI003F6EACC3
MLRLLLLVPLAAALGCGGSNMGQVSGTVTYKGKPVAPGVIQFYPANGPMAFGGLDANGHFTLTTKTPGDGAPVGEHRVCVLPFVPGTGEMGPGKPQFDLDPKNIPHKYRDRETTPLRVEVKPDKTIEVVFELED